MVSRLLTVVALLALAGAAPAAAQTVKKHRRGFYLGAHETRTFRVRFPKLTRQEKRHAGCSGHYTVTLSGKFAHRGRVPDTGLVEPVRDYHSSFSPPVVRIRVWNANEEGTQPLRVVLVAFCIVR